MNKLYFFLPGILILGLITSFTDIKFGKIRNKWVLFGLLYGLIINMILFSYYINTGNLRIDYFFEFLINSGFGLAIGFGFWLSGIWTAGDGKLFFAYAVLVPLSGYVNGYIKWVPSTILLINVFVPMFLYFSVISIFKSNWKIKKSILRDFFSAKLLNMFFYLFIIHWFVSLFSVNGFFTRGILSILIYYLFGKKLKTEEKISPKFILIILALSSIRFILDKNVYTSFFWREFLLLFVFLILFRLIINLGADSFNKEISIKNLKPGMVLAESIIKKGKKYEKKKKKGIWSIKDTFIEELPEGINKEDIKKLKKTKIKIIKIKQTLPFAPFMFLAVLLTIIVKGNILILVNFLF